MKKNLLILAVIMASLSNIAHAEHTTSSPLTQGNVQRVIQKGVTTQTAILECFGAPNITTADAEGNDVWTYQGQSTAETGKAKTLYGTLFLLGAGKTTTGFEQSSKTMTLIIKFGPDKKVTEYKSMYTSF